MFPGNWKKYTVQHLKSLILSNDNVCIICLGIFMNGTHCIDCQFKVIMAYLHCSQIGLLNFSYAQRNAWRSFCCSTELGVVLRLLQSTSTRRLRHCIERQLLLQPHIPARIDILFPAAIQ